MRVVLPLPVCVCVCAPLFLKYLNDVVTKSRTLRFFGLFFLFFFFIFIICVAAGAAGSSCIWRFRCVPKHFPSSIQMPLLRLHLYPAGSGLHAAAPQKKKSEHMIVSHSRLSSVNTYSCTDIHFMGTEIHTKRRWLERKTLAKTKRDQTLPSARHIIIQHNTQHILTHSCPCEDTARFAATATLDKFR